MRNFISAMICLFVYGIPLFSLAQEVGLDANRSTFASRLADSKNVGLQVDEKLAIAIPEYADRDRCCQTLNMSNFRRCQSNALVGR